MTEATTLTAALAMAGIDLARKLYAERRPPTLEELESLNAQRVAAETAWNQLAPEVSP